MNKIPIIVCLILLTPTISYCATFRTINENILRAVSSGNVGVGSLNPAYKLDIVGDANVSTQLRSNLIGIGGVVPKTYDLTSAVVSFYKLEENAANTTVADTQGTNAGTSSSNTSVYSTTGIINNAFSFASVRKVDLGSSSTLKFTGDFAIAFWMNTGSNNMMVLGNRSNSGENVGIRISVNSSSNVALLIDTGAGATTSTNGSINVSNSLWYFVVIQRDGSTATIYVNAAVDGTPVSISGDQGTNAGNMILGNIPLALQTNYTGKLDNVMFFSRPLTTTEIAFLYNSGSGTETFLGNGYYNIIGTTTNLASTHSLTSVKDLLIEGKLEIDGVTYHDNNVGIGSSVPVAALDVVGSVRTTAFQLSTNPSSNYILTSNSVGIGTWMPLPASGSGTVSSGTADTVAIYDSAGTTVTSSSVITDNNTNIGLGSTIPVQKLDVLGTVRATAFIGDGSGITGIGGSISGLTTNQVTKATGSTTIGDSSITESGGNVGIGTTLSASRLDIQGGVGIGTSYAGYFSAPSNSLIVQGNVGIGTTTPQNSLSIVGGNVGIGTWVPKSSLQVIGNVGIGTTLSTAAIEIGNGLLKISTAGVITGVASSVMNPNLLSQGVSGRVMVANSGGTWTSTTISSDATVGSTGTLTIQDGAVDPTDTNFSTGGNIGIGTVARANSLSIQGNVGIGTIVNDPYVSVSAPSGGLIAGGNIGIGTWTADGGRLIVKGANVGIGSAWPGTQLDVVGTMRLLGTGAGGFVIQSAGNQACTTTCTTGKAIMGFDQGTLGAVLPNIVSPTDATADECLCGG